MSLSKIDAVEEYISSLIQNKQENEFVDFKQFYYHEDKKYAENYQERDQMQEMWRRY